MRLTFLKFFCKCDLVCTNNELKEKDKRGNFKSQSVDLSFDVKDLFSCYLKNEI